MFQFNTNMINIALRKGMFKEVSFEIRFEGSHRIDSMNVRRERESSRGENQSN